VTATTRRAQHARRHRKEVGLRIEPFEEYTAHLNITGAVPLPGAEGIMAENYDPDAEVPGPDDPFSRVSRMSDQHWSRDPLRCRWEVRPRE